MLGDSKYLDTVNLSEEDVFVYHSKYKQLLHFSINRIKLDQVHVYFPNKREIEEWE